MGILGPPRNSTLVLLRAAYNACKRFAVYIEDSGCCLLVPASMLEHFSHITLLDIRQRRICTSCAHRTVLNILARGTGRAANPSRKVLGIYYPVAQRNGMQNCVLQLADISGPGVRP